MLAAEADGLRALAAMHTVRVPAVAADGPGWLALEWLDLHPAGAGFGERFGAALAALHAAPCPLDPTAFGWSRDNFIGATPQANRRMADWTAFFTTQRIGPMRHRLAQHAGMQSLIAEVDGLLAGLPRWLRGHAPESSLVHGDLWQGNWAMLAHGEPVVFDPAVSCSDAETDLAMMELFGSLPAGFLAAYREASGLDPEGYAQRRPLYQLYHLLNHAVLFGGGYVQQAQAYARACAARMRG
jgi:fructosamine-3-kinase